MGKEKQTLGAPLFLLSTWHLLSVVYLNYKPMSWSNVGRPLCLPDKLIKVRSIIQGFWLLFTRFLLLLFSRPVMSDSATPWTAACQASLCLTISWSLPKFMFIASVMSSSYLTLWHPLLLLPSIFPSIRDSSNELSVYIKWPKYWSFSFSISPSSAYSELISFRIDWFDLMRGL